MAVALVREKVAEARGYDRQLNRGEGKMGSRRCCTVSPCCVFLSFWSITCVAVPIIVALVAVFLGCPATDGARQTCLKAHASSNSSSAICAKKEHKEYVRCLIIMIPVVTGAVWFVLFLMMGGVAGVIARAHQDFLDSQSNRKERPLETAR